MKAVPRAGPSATKATSWFVPPIVVPAFFARFFLIDLYLERDSRGYERTFSGHGGLALRRVLRSDGCQACGDEPHQRRVGASHLRVRRVRS